METREILIANTRTQQQVKIMTDATTLGELKAALDENDIDYTDMSFMVGKPKQELISDDAQLPTNVRYNDGTVSNNLIILLTNSKKKIDSGAEDRKTAYQVIKENDLQEEVKEEFGRNFTLVGTTDLWDFIHRTIGEPDLPEEEDEEEGDDEEGLYNFEENDRENAIDNLFNGLYDTIKALTALGIFKAHDINDFIGSLTELHDILKEEEGAENEEKDENIQVGNVNISSKELRDMIAEA